VYIDSQYAGETPGTFTDLLPGMYTVRVEREDCMPAAYNVTVEAGVTTTLSVALPYLTPVPDTGSTLSTGLPGFEAVLCCMAFAWIAALQGMRF
jgi:hypothetical protein